MLAYFYCAAYTQVKVNESSTLVTGGRIHSVQ